MKIFLPYLMIGALLLAPACSYIPSLDKALPDKRKDYQKSETLPDLEIPPDLTADAFNDNMAIPNEGPATLSRFKNAPVAGKGDSGVSESEEQWLAVRGSAADIWPGLREYFSGKGYALELDDAQLGVLVTGWSAPVESDGRLYRNRYKIFSEPGADQNSTVLFITNQSQQRIGQARILNKTQNDGRDKEAGWLDLERDRDAERQLVAELNRQLSGDNNASLNTQAGRPRPEVLDIGDGKLYLALPDEFTRAWRKTGLVMQQAGMKITGQDQTKGLYTISYFDDTDAEQGFFSKLKFWGDKGPQAVTYQLNLTGVGSKTELVVMDADGDWDNSENAKRILSLIRDRYDAGRG